VSARSARARRDWMERGGILMLCLIAAAGFAWVGFIGARSLGRVLFSDNPRYAIANYDIHSDGMEISGRFIRQLCSLQDGLNLFAISLQELQQQIETVPLVQRAQVQRILPNTLRISIVERMAVACLDRGDTPYKVAVDRDGYVFVMRKFREDTSLPVITGLDPSLKPRSGERAESADLTDALRVLEMCSEDKRLARILDVKRIDVRDKEILKLHLQDGWLAHVARADLEERIKDLAVAIQDREESGANWTFFNMTVEKNPIVK